mgnify:CR=1 FL=1
MAVTWVTVSMVDRVDHWYCTDAVSVPLCAAVHDDTEVDPEVDSVSCYFKNIHHLTYEYHDATRLV